MKTISIQSEHFKLTIDTLEQNVRLLQTLDNQSRGGVYGVESLKTGVSAISSAVKITTGQADASSLFGVISSAYNAFTQWKTMWEEVKELDWQDAYELGKHVVSELLPFIGGLFGTKDVHGLGVRFAALEQYQTSRDVAGYSDEEIAAIGQIMYSDVFPQFAH